MSLIAQATWLKFHAVLCGEHEGPSLGVKPTGMEESYHGSQPEQIDNLNYEFLVTEQSRSSYLID
jgi:hypothetical protein